MNLIFHNINSNDTKQQIIDKFDELNNCFFRQLNDMESSYLFKHFTMESELLTLYRAMYKGKKIDIKLKELEYRHNEMNRDLKTIFKIIKKL